MDDNRAEAWEFLLQCKGDPTWMPLVGDRLALVEGRYRIVLYKPNTVGAEVDVRVTFSDLTTNPPKCRSEQRHCRTDRQGMALAIPPTHLKPGRWEIRCYGDLLSELSGSAWQKRICLEVTPSAALATAAAAELVIESVLAEPEAHEDRREDHKKEVAAAAPLSLALPDAREPAVADAIFETTTIAFDFVAGAAMPTSEPALEPETAPLLPPPTPRAIAPDPATAPQQLGISPSRLRSQFLGNLDRHLGAALAALEAILSQEQAAPSDPPHLSEADTSVARGERGSQNRAKPLSARPAPPPSLLPPAKPRRAGPQLPPVPGPQTNLRAQVSHLLSERQPEDFAGGDGRVYLPEFSPAPVSDDWEAMAAMAPTPASSLAAPHLEVPAEPIAGQPTRVRVRLPADSAADAIKLWLLDGNSGLLLDGPQRISQFIRNRHGEREAATELKMPFGCLVARLEAIALQEAHDCASTKVAVERCVSLPDVRRARSALFRAQPAKISVYSHKTPL